jgi:pilus assembly protein Flp/PilA
MLDYLRTLLRARAARFDQRGATAVEYGLLIVGIAAVIALIVFAFGHVLVSVFDDTCDSLGSKSGNGNCSS